MEKIPNNVENLEQSEQIVHPEESILSKENTAEESDTTIESKISFYDQLFTGCKEKIDSLKNVAKAAAFFVVTSGVVQEAQAQNSLPNFDSLAQKQSVRSIVKDTYESYVSKNKDTTYRIIESSSEQKATQKDGKKWKKVPEEHSATIEGSSFFLPQEEDTIIYKNVDVKTFTVLGDSEDNTKFSQKQYQEHEGESSQSFKNFEAVKVQDTVSTTEVETNNTFKSIAETKERAIISALGMASALLKSEIQSQTLLYNQEKQKNISKDEKIISKTDDYISQFRTLKMNESDNHFDAVKVVVKKVNVLGKDMYEATVLY